MKTVNVGELKNQLSAYLQYVRSGEEVVVKDRSIPVARILPFHESDPSDAEAQLVASGAMKLPGQKMDWDQFFSRRSKAKITRADAVKAAIEARGDR